MGRNVETQDVAHHGLDLLDPRIAEFKNVLTVLADQVVVLAVSIRPFKKGEVLSELVACDEFAVQQQLDRIVKRRPADPVTDRKSTRLNSSHRT